MKTTVALLLLLLIMVACSAEPETVEVTRLVEVPVEVTRIVEVVAEVVEAEASRDLFYREVEVEVVEVEVTRIVEQPTEVTRIVEVVAEPEPMPKEEFFRLDGVDTLVSENYEFGSCNKAVWYAHANQADGNFYVWLWDANCTGSENDCKDNIVDIAPYDGEQNGQVLTRISGGEYFLEVEHAPGGGWTIWAECQS
jgi:hypothetical protein